MHCIGCKVRSADPRQHTSSGEHAQTCVRQYFVQLFVPDDPILGYILQTQPKECSIPLAHGRPHISTDNMYHLSVGNGSSDEPDFTDWEVQ